MAQSNYIPYRFTLFILMVFSLLISCEKEPTTDLTQSVLIPTPVSVSATGDVFKIKRSTNIYLKSNLDEVNFAADFLGDLLSRSTGFSFDANQTGEEPPAGSIVFELADDAELGKEGYILDITEDRLTVTANDPTGLFWGVQTIRQLLPAEVEANTKQSAKWEIPTGTIRDFPTYSYRGSMLDVSRHFFGVDDVKRYIDFLVAFKMNFMHLHLTDDQGWRIEINKWPNLTAHGGSTEVGGKKGSFFYTQEQYKEIVQYAADRHITIVPEIDMPGHTNAALASYPELNCNGKATELYTGTEVGFSSFCTDKEITYQFVDDVIKELVAITPGPYIHIGGDESHSTKKEDYLLFVNRVKGIVEKYGKTMIGWDETAQADLNANSVVQLWASPEFAKEAVSKGAKLIMSPATKAYLDMSYDSTTHLGLHWAAYIEVDSAYIWDPATFLPGISNDHIIGVEAPLWTETITNMDELEYMVFPRLPGYAEIGWTASAKRNWETYKMRLAAFNNRFEIMDIDFYKSKFVPWQEDGAVKSP